LGDPAAEVRLTRKRADTLRVLGRTEGAIAAAEEALTKARGLGMVDEEIESLNTLGFVFANREGKYVKAAELHGEALSLAEKAGNRQTQAVSLGHLGLTSWHVGDYGKAINHFERALALQRESGDRRGLATTLNFAGLAYHRRGQFERALAYHREALEAKQSMSDHRAIPGTLNNIGEILRDVHDISGAVEHHRRALALAREQNNPAAECDNLRDLAADHLAAGETSIARECAEEVLETAIRHRLPWYETRAYITLGEIACRTGDAENAERNSSLAVSGANALDARELRIEALKSRAEVLMAASRPAEAEGLISEAIHIAEDSGHALFLWQMYALLSACQRSLAKEEEARASMATAKEYLTERLESFSSPDWKERYLGLPEVQGVLAGRG
jgi:tetratricopeptide (TPR) repeat protein